MKPTPMGKSSNTAMPATLRGSSERRASEVDQRPGSVFTAFSKAMRLGGRVSIRAGRAEMLSR